MANADYPHVRVIRRRLPGSTLHELVLGDGRTLTLVRGHTSHAYDLYLRGPHDDEAEAVTHLSAAEAATVAALISNVYVTVEDDTDGDRTEPHVEVMRIGNESQAVGLTPAQISVSDPDGVRVLAVIRDETPQLVEDDTEPCRAGDRLVVVGRAPGLDELRAYLQ